MRPNYAPTPQNVAEQGSSFALTYKFCNVSNNPKFRRTPEESVTAILYGTSADDVEKQYEKVLEDHRDWERVTTTPECTPIKGKPHELTGQGTGA